MFRAFVLAALAASAAAFAPVARPGRAKVAMKVSSDNLPQKIGSALGAAALAFGLVGSIPSNAIAASGEGAKLSIFGAAPMSSPYATEPDMYSPYSPWGDGADAIYEARLPDEVKDKVGKVKESAKRFPNFEKYIKKKTWLEVYSESQRQMYEMRYNMNYLADYKGTKAAKAAAKDFYAKFERMAVASQQKQQPQALAAYTEAKAALDKYLSLL